MLGVCAGHISRCAPRGSMRGARERVMEQSVIVEAVRRIPPHRAAMGRVLAVLDDPGSSASDVARAATPDAGFCARLLRFANSAYFGLSGQVGSVERAVATVGSSVVRSLAVSTAAGLLGNDEVLPDGFWVHCAAVG